MATLDTLQDAVNVLTTSTTSLVNEVQTKKAVLDAAVDDAQGAQVAAQSARDTAEGHKLAAEAAATSATSTAAALTGFDLDAIAASKAVTAVDVFVYDTSRDSDGGAWRKRTQHTSWYNETLNTATRGARREFPAVAVIVAETNKVTIYDGDDPALPMWMVFQQSGFGSILGGGNITSIAFQNGLLVTVGNPNGDVQGIDFLGDRGARVFDSSSVSNFNGNIAERGVQKGHTLGSSWLADTGVLNRNINDVAMTILADSPIDPATGLPVPTIAVATAGGVSVITDSGAVYDSAKATAATDATIDGERLRIAFTDSDVLAYDLASIAADSFTGDIFDPATTPALLGTTTTLAKAASGSTTGMTLLAEDEATPADGMIARVTSSYNSGYQVGDIKGAFLSDTDDTDLVGSGELVTNGTFDTDTSGWTDNSVGGSSISWNVSGYINLNVSAASEVALADQSITTVVGQTYVISIAAINSVNSTAIFVGTSLGNNNLVSQGIGTAGSYSFTFTATTTTTYIRLYSNNGGGGAATASLDNISVKLADADRSVNNKGLIVNGTVSRDPVATGADLVAYDCNAGYLFRDFAAEFNGADTFCLMGWHYGDPDKTGNFFSWYETVGGGTSAAFLNGFIDATTGAYALVWQGRASLLPNTTPSISGRWALVVLVFSANTIKFYLDGQLVHAGTGVPSVDLHELRINPNGGNKNALLRISATAPTAEQIKKIYNDEKFLFQDNAQATLYGTSDAVTALAHDDATDLLHVGTSAGRSVFSGLRRVSNTANAVTTAISASNGLIAEE